MTTTQTDVSGTPFPAAFTAGWYWPPQIWQQQMYQQKIWQLAYARAWAAVYGPPPVRVRAACLPRVLRN